MGFLTVIYIGLDGQVIGKGTTDFRNHLEAEIQWHIALSSAMSKEEYSKVIAIVFDEDGQLLFRRVWEREE